MRRLCVVSSCCCSVGLLCIVGVRSHFWTPEVLFSLLTWTWARRVAPSLRRLGSTCRRCLLAPGGSLPVFLSPPSRCGALDALAGCDSASSAAFPWRMTSVAVSVFGVATVCRFASRRPIAALVGHVRLGPIAVFLVVQTSSLSACCVATRSLVLHLPCPLSFSVSPQTRLFVMRPPAVASDCSWRSGRRLLAPWEVWVGAARRGTFCY